MSPNPVLRELGFSENDRVAILHADDIGLCQASVAAMDGLAGAGVVSSMAAMVVCPWFPAAAAYYRSHPGIDLGLHFTITCECDVYRWGPVSTRDSSTGLLDSDGWFFRGSGQVQKAAKASAVKAELAAQIRLAQAAGIDLTHVDSHSGAAWHPKFLPGYAQLPARQGIPAFFFRMDRAIAHDWGYDSAGADRMTRMAAEMEARERILFDRFFMMPLDNANDRVAVAQRALAALPPGLSYFVLHPACDLPELRALTPDWKCRVADYEAFTSRELSIFLKNSGIRVIGWKTLRDWMRGKQGKISC